MRAWSLTTAPQPGTGAGLRAAAGRLREGGAATSWSAHVAAAGLDPSVRVNTARRAPPAGPGADRGRGGAPICWSSAPAAGAGSRGLLLGSVSDQCVHHAPCPVTVVRTGARPRWTRPAEPAGRRPTARLRRSAGDRVPAGAATSAAICVGPGADRRPSRGSRRRARASRLTMARSPNDSRVVVEPAGEHAVPARARSARVSGADVVRLVGRERRHRRSGRWRTATPGRERSAAAWRGRVLAGRLQPPAGVDRAAQHARRRTAAGSGRCSTGTATATSPAARPAGTRRSRGPARRRSPRCDAVPAGDHDQDPAGRAAHRRASARTGTTATGQAGAVQHAVRGRPERPVRVRCPTTSSWAVSDGGDERAGGPVADDGLAHDDVGFLLPPAGQRLGRAARCSSASTPAQSTSGPTERNAVSSATSCQACTATGRCPATPPRRRRRPAPPRRPGGPRRRRRPSAGRRTTRGVARRGARRRGSRAWATTPAAVEPTQQAGDAAGAAAAERPAAAPRRTRLTQRGRRVRRRRPRW